MMNNHLRGRPAVSDDEKRRRGTFREDQSEQSRLGRMGAKVVVGHFLSIVPQPELPLSEVGKAKYIELSEMLLRQDKLTTFTKMQAELAGVAWGQISSRMQSDKPVPNALMRSFSTAVGLLRLTDDAAPVVPDGKKRTGKFAGVGFSIRSHKAG